MKIAILLLICMMVSCDEHKVTRGIVTDKQFIPEITKIIETSGKPQNIYYNPKWYLVVRGVYKGDTIQDFHQVTQQQYDRVSVNDSVLFTKAK